MWNDEIKLIYKYISYNLIYIIYKTIKLIVRDFLR
jgi:hypothetical protein